MFIPLEEQFGWTRGQIAVGQSSFMICGGLGGVLMGRLVSQYGSIEALVYPHPGMPPDVVSVPIGQGHRARGRYAEGRGANVLSLLAPLADETTGALAWAARSPGCVPTR